jgi:hypothetical protein
LEQLSRRVHRIALADVDSETAFAKQSREFFEMETVEPMLLARCSFVDNAV